METTPNVESIAVEQINYDYMRGLKDGWDDGAEGARPKNIKDAVRQYMQHADTLLGTVEMEAMHNDVLDGECAKWDRIRTRWTNRHATLCKKLQIAKRERTGTEFDWHADAGEASTIYIKGKQVDHDFEASLSDQIAQAAQFARYAASVFEIAASEYFKATGNNYVTLEARKPKPKMHSVTLEQMADAWLAFQPDPQKTQRIAIFGDAQADKTTYNRVLAGMKRCVEKWPSITFCTGTMSGVEAYVRETARILRRQCIVHSPNFDRDGKSAGYRANEAIVADFHPHMIAFYGNELTGKARHLKKLAEASGIEFHWITLADQPEKAAEHA